METTIPEMVFPQSMPTTGTVGQAPRVISDFSFVRYYTSLLYCSGIQKGSTDIANLLPIIDTGIVEQSMLNKTTKNLKEEKSKCIGSMQGNNITI